MRPGRRTVFCSRFRTGAGSLVAALRAGRVRVTEAFEKGTRKFGTDLLVTVPVFIVASLVLTTVQGTPQAGVPPAGAPGASGGPVAAAAVACKTTLETPTEGATSVTGEFSPDCSPAPTSARLEVYSGSRLLFATMATTFDTTNDTFTFTSVPVLGAGQSLHVHLYYVGTGASGASGATGRRQASYADTRVDELGYDWGRVKAYFTAGAQFVRQQGAFGSADPYVSGNVDANWYTSPQLSACPARPEDIQGLAPDSESRLIDVAPLTTANKLLSKGAIGPADAITIANTVLQIAGATGASGATGGLAAATHALDVARGAIGPSGTIGAGGATGKALVEVARTAIDRVETILMQYPRVYCSSSAGPRIAHRKALPDSVHASIESAIDQISFGASGASGGTSGASGASGAVGITSKSGASVAVVIYAPYYVTRWLHSNGDNALFIAPLFKFGFDAPSNASLPTGVTITPQDVYLNYSAGFRVGHFSLNPHPESKSPELMSYGDFSIGKWDEFRQMSTEPGHTYRRPWRFEGKGQLKLPGTPFYLGTQVNVGSGPDDYRLFVGTRFDISKMLSKIIPTTQ